MLRRFLKVLGWNFNLALIHRDMAENDKKKIRTQKFQVTY